MSLDSVRCLLHRRQLLTDISLRRSEFITATTVDGAYETPCPAYAWEDVGGDVEEGSGAIVYLASHLAR